MDAPYRVEVQARRSWGNEYAIYHTSDGVIVTGTDVVLMHRIAELLNEDREARDVHR